MQISLYLRPILTFAFFRNYFHKQRSCDEKFEHWLNIAQNRWLPSSYILYDIYISKWLESKELQLIQLENPRTLDEARKFVNFVHKEEERPKKYRIRGDMSPARLEGARIIRFGEGWSQHGSTCDAIFISETQIEVGSIVRKGVFFMKES